MSAPARKATYADIEALPEHVGGELIDGTLHTQGRPAGPHILVGSVLVGELFTSFGGRSTPGGWVILVEPELRFGNDVLVPDLAAWRVERLPPAARRGAAFDVVPDWVCEIASPSTSMLDRRIKMPIYANVGVTNLWLVEPIFCRVEAYERVDSRWTVVGTWGEDLEARIPPFDSATLDLVRLWDGTGRNG